MARFGERLRALAGTVASATSPAAVRGAGDTTATPIDALVADTQGARAEVSRRLEEGRDRLLEWSSHRPATARPIVDAIAAEDRQPSLDQFLLAVLDLYMIEVEELSPRTYRIGSAGVLVDDFPGLSADRVTVTSDRARALEREDFQFLTWDHPLATGALDLLFGSEHGNCSVARWIDDVQELYLETVWVLECVAPAHLGADRFLPPTPLRTIVDRRGVDVSGTLTPAQLTSVLVKAEGGRGLLANPRVRDELLPRLLDRNRQLADAQTPAVIAEAQRAARARIGREADRLVDLRRRNPSVRQEEIDALRDQQQQLEAQLGAARLRLDGVRLIHRGPGRTGPASGA